MTGAAGFIGSHTVEQLVRDGEQVVGLDIKAAPMALYELCDEFPDRLKLKVFDITSSINFDEYIEPGDKILHLAAVAHFVDETRVQDAVEVNIFGTVRMLQAAIANKAERFVYSSTGSVYNQPVSPPIREDHFLGPTFDNYYGWSKLQAEQWIRNFHDKLPYVTLRYAYVYGLRKSWGAIGNWLYNDIPNKKAPVIYGGRQSNDFIYIKDLVQANISALKTHNLNQIFNIGTGRATSIWDACDLCVKATDSNLSPIVKEPRSFDYSAFFYDMNKAREVLKFNPRWELEFGIVDMISEMKKEGTIK